MVDDVSYASQSMITTLFNYKLKERFECVDIADDAAKEFHQDKYNMLSNQRNTLRKKKK
jgi:hypothetical protein